ncbi:hypothetical protein N0V90_011408 [Kalmusia sp. IMI 367209]|nr:hypothetical protein N0V90_011408 [Kalmusia sp. IMI 367209]
MSSTSPFPQLPQELRDMVWQAAAPVQYQQVAGSQPISCATGCAERLRQAFVGYNNLPEGTEIQPLRIYVHDSGDKLRLGINEFQTFINRLPTASVHTEARSHTTDFCRDELKLVNLLYYMDTPDEPSDIGDVITEPISFQPPTVMVSNAYRNYHGPKGFKSAEHLVDILHRVFGSGVERIIFNSQVESMNTMEEIYWPNTAKMESLEDITAHNTDRDMDPRGFDQSQVASHLLRFREVFDAAAQKLPQLQSIELQLHTYSWGEPLPTRIKATKKKGDALWVNWSDVEIGFNHRFAGFDGFCEKK